jgi:transcription elongation factor GreA
MTDRIPITKDGLEKIKAELHQLITVERQAVKKDISEAREHGDLKENAEYAAAKERQSFIEGRIQEINSRMPKFQVVDPSAHDSDTVIFGAKVTIENVDSGESLTYQIVGPDEADLKMNKISVLSPVAKALIGKEVGDVVIVEIPRGKMEVEISAVRYS